MGPRCRALSSARESTPYSAPECVQLSSRETISVRDWIGFAGRDGHRGCTGSHAEINQPAIIACLGAPMRKLILSLVLFSTSFLAAQQYDVVLEGGRVMDPETGLDAVRSVGIRDGKIARIASEPLTGRRVVNATGLVI